MLSTGDKERFFNTFFDYVRLLVDIPEGDQEICRQYFKPQIVKKNTILERAGEIHRHHNFVVSGYLRMYQVNDKGEEIVTDLNDGPRFFTSYTNFANRTPSNEYIECITDCELLRITRDNVDITAKLGETQMQYSFMILEQHLEERKQKGIDLINLSAEERYEKLMKNHPTILQNVPLNYIASYLGIHPASLSRIRKRIG